MKRSILEAGVPSFAATTDLYELTMARALHEEARNPVAWFEMFIRSTGPRRGYLVAAGLEQALDYLEALAFDGGTVEALRRLPGLSGAPADFFEYLRAFRFTGDVRAMPEGTVFFAGEPLLSVRAPLIEAQIVESFLLSVLGYETLVASKAARVTEAAAGRDVVEFGLRRGHGPHAGILAARAAYIGGAIATSNVDAALRLGIGASGTMAHSFVLAHDSEDEAFRAFVRSQGKRAVLLIDTVDTEAAARRIGTMGDLAFAGVRLDSGDLLALSRSVRDILDRAGRADVRIFASGDLDEDRIDGLVRAGAPIDGFGVGTDLITSRDHPALGAVYKLVAIEEGGRLLPRAKQSPGKATLPLPKQVFRAIAEGHFRGDVLGLEDDAAPPGTTPLLVPVMAFGSRLDPEPTLDEARRRFLAGRESLPPELRSIRSATEATVTLSPRLRAASEAAGVL